MRQRRFLPPMPQLLAFDAVVRHGSVTEAARALDLTQSSVSRLLQGLEGQLGTALFIRHRQRLTVTDAARAYHADIAAALDLVQRASLRLIANPGGGALALAVLPTFAARWLGPRLGSFLDAHPGTSVNLSTRIGPFALEQEGFDAAIYFGTDPWPGLQNMRLFGEHLTACAAPDLLNRHPVTRPQDMDGLPLLQLESRNGAWDDWFTGQSARPRPATGMVMDQFAMMIQVATAGLGVALLPDYLARPELAEGRLQAILQPAVTGRGAYWLAWPQARDSHQPLTAFRTWMAGQTA